MNTDTEKAGLNKTNTPKTLDLFNCGLYIIYIYIEVIAFS